MHIVTPRETQILKEQRKSAPPTTFASEKLTVKDHVTDILRASSKLEFVYVIAVGTYCSKFLVDLF